MIPTPSILARLRRAPAEPPAHATTPKPSPPRAWTRPITVNPPPRARPMFDDSPLTEADEAREAAVLTRLATLTTHYDDPWAAAKALFGGPDD